ncbi:MAG: tetratricopeptide repeat protein [Deltaproteobacteria bacterium]|nr:tetratricopeptide repeat protein [Deltaproteobacteria bacterium]MDQ3297821.1 tetratricopeptide repeat protein [Myxococcota bacterium]
MRTLVLLTLLALLGTAAAAPPRAVRKPPPANISAEALDQLVYAVLADKAGDYDDALRLYENANRSAPHPNITYNIADLHRRLEKLDRAIEGYKKYIELAPTAPDRAAVEKLIAELARTPGVAVIDGEDLDAIVFVDGKLIGPSPVVISLPEGRHVFERIGPRSYGSQEMTVKPMSRHHVSLGSSRDEGGNVVFHGPPGTTRGSWEDRGHKFRMAGRFTLPPGRHDTFLLSPGRACTPIAFDVPPGDDVVVHVFIDMKPVKGTGCIPITVRANKIVFPPRARDAAIREVAP